MNLKPQKRIAAALLKCGINRVVFDPAMIKELKEALTKADLKAMINDKAIRRAQKRGISSGRSKKIKHQKSKSLRKGKGSRKGTTNSRIPKKRMWMNKVRIQREFLKSLKKKEAITTKDFRNTYKKVKGGFFRSKAHLKLYLNENNLIKVKK